MPSPSPSAPKPASPGSILDRQSVPQGGGGLAIAFVKKLGGQTSPATWRTWSTRSPGPGPLRWWSAAIREIFGVINLKDIVKGGIQERFLQLRSMGIKTVMITGDNPLTAAAIAAEAQVDDFLAQAKPEDKLRLIREYQEAGLHGGHDRRRHQRRPGPGPGRRGGGHEHRHPAGPRGGQHHRSGQQPDQAPGYRRDRQADPDDPGQSDHLQHLQRHRQVFCHHPGGACFPSIRNWGCSTSCTWPALTAPSCRR